MSQISQPGQLGERGSSLAELHSSPLASLFNIRDIVAYRPT